MNIILMLTVAVLVVYVLANLEDNDPHDRETQLT
jgi:hypothetical protein